MAKISKHDLNHFSDDEIRVICKTNEWREMPEPILSYYQQGFNKKGEISNELDRVFSLLKGIIVSRFLRK